MKRKATFRSGKLTDANSRAADSLHQLMHMTGIQFGHGVPQKGYPTRCLKCKGPICEEDTWQKWNSPYDPVHGSYAVIYHSRCVPSPQGTGNGRH